MTKMFRTNRKDVPLVEGLKRDDGWIDMQVQFLIDKKSAGTDNVVGWTVLKPGASHEHTCTETATNFSSSSRVTVTSSPITALSLPAKAMSCIRRAVAGMASTTRRMKTSSSCGAGWAPARSTLRDTKCQKKGIETHAFTLGRSTDHARHGRSTRSAAQKDR